LWSFAKTLTQSFKLKQVSCEYKFLHRQRHTHKHRERERHAQILLCFDVITNINKQTCHTKHAWLLQLAGVINYIEITVHIANLALDTCYVIVIIWSWQGMTINYYTCLWNPNNSLVKMNLNLLTKTSRQRSGHFVQTIAHTDRSHKHAWLSLQLASVINTGVFVRFK